jgi:hypothetical protein
MEYSMRRVRIESHSRDLIAGFVAGVEWVNDSAVSVVEFDYRGKTSFVVLEDRDASGKEEVMHLTDNGNEGKE